MENRSRKRLYAWAKSEDLWIRRISMVSTLWFIRKGDLEDAFSIARIHLNDEHDLMHKAVGWMLRECGKKDLKKLENFLDSWSSKMPRTSLRYSIEKMSERKRKFYLTKDKN